MAKIVNCNHKTILRNLRDFNIKTRNPSEAVSEKHKQIIRMLRWKGGRGINHSGYILLFMPWHPNSNQRGYVFEHVLIASQILKRPLKKTESVHHINGIKTDNRPQNFVICTNSYHRWLENNMANLYKQEKFYNNININDYNKELESTLFRA